MFNFFLPENEKKLKSSLKNILGFYPGNIALYTQAFRHHSIAKEIKEGVRDSNERLEFLGDAVLSIVVAEYLFKKYPYKDEGCLTKMRSKIVSRNQLNQLAIKLGLNKLLLLTNDPFMKSASMHGDAFEALIGAVYLDKGYVATQKFILNRLMKFHMDVEKIIITETDFKSKLIEWSQKEKKQIRFEVIEEIGLGHNRQYIVAAQLNGETIAESQHFSKKKAEQLVAETACNKLEIA